MNYQQLGRYKLGEAIATGSHARLYTVHDNTNLVIKVFPASLAEEASYSERFDRELERVSQLEHPHILRPVDYGVDGDVSYIVLPFCRGGSLHAHLAAGNPLTAGTTIEILRQVAKAIDYAHEQGTVHRDVRPGNILFDDESRAYLADFGLAKIIQETYALYGDTRLVSDPAFTAPEQWQGSLGGAATDRYALGIIAYLLLTGKLPFEASTPGAVKYQHLNEFPTPVSVQRPEIPAAVDEVIAKTLAKQPDQRYAAASEFVQALAEAVQGEPIIVPEMVESHKQTEPQVTQIPLRRPKTVTWWLRRLGCLLILVVWLLLMASPCLIVTVLVQGEATFALSDKPGHQVRIFKVQSDEARGIGFSIGTVQNESTDAACILTQVRFLLWQGRSQPTNYCQCFTYISGEWWPDPPVNDECSPLQSGQ
jgi:serine/threonine protein kinase